MVVLVVVIVVAVGAAVGVVVRASRRIQPVEVPHNLVPQTPDTAFVRFRRGKRRQLAKLERRYQKYRDRDSVHTAEQDSLIRVIDSGFAAVRAELAVLDTLTAGRARIELAKRIRTAYAELKKPVYRFTGTFAPAVPDVNPDSLDEVLRRLISE